MQFHLFRTSFGISYCWLFPVLYRMPHYRHGQKARFPQVCQPAPAPDAGSSNVKTAKPSRKLRQCVHWSNCPQIAPTESPRGEDFTPQEEWLTSAQVSAETFWNQDHYNWLSLLCFSYRNPSQLLVIPTEAQTIHHTWPTSTLAPQGKCWLFNWHF